MECKWTSGRKWDKKTLILCVGESKKLNRALRGIHVSELRNSASCQRQDVVWERVKITLKVRLNYLYFSMKRHYKQGLGYSCRG